MADEKIVVVCDENCKHCIFCGFCCEVGTSDDTEIKTPNKGDVVTIEITRNKDLTE